VVPVKEDSFNVSAPVTSSPDVLAFPLMSAMSRWVVRCKVATVLHGPVAWTMRLDCRISVLFQVSMAIVRSRHHCIVDCRRTKLHSGSHVRYQGNYTISDLKLLIILRLGMNSSCWIHLARNYLLYTLPLRPVCLFYYVHCRSVVAREHPSEPIHCTVHGCVPRPGRGPSCAARAHARACTWHALPLA
jgi:hypothetical protein